MTGHLDAFSTEERDALDVVAKLHDLLRKQQTPRATCLDEAAAYAQLVVRCTEMIEDDPRLLIELGRRQTTSINLADGVTTQGEILCFYHNEQDLRGAGLLTLKEVRVNVNAWQRTCGEMLAARRNPPTTH
ncbi:hypothetical protein ACLKMY_37805 [Paraburkholderia mimosarum]|uniref:hypothetical protein n=1 Tax=Paraburkholderia mimosarum TaxID=312026 RepID=UPI0039C06DE7